MDGDQHSCVWLSAVVGVEMKSLTDVQGLNIIQGH